jgi:hypothetical protein
MQFLFNIIIVKVTITKLMYFSMLRNGTYGQIWHWFIAKMLCEAVWKSATATATATTITTTTTTNNNNNNNNEHIFGR